MKLLFCNRCGDIVALTNQERSCKCNHSRGHYTDSLNAVVYGKNAMVIGFNNSQFYSAVHGMKNLKGLTPQAAKDIGNFKAWVCYPPHTLTVEYKEE